MKKFIISLLKILSWILIYFLNFCIMIKIDADIKDILPLLSLISGPILFLIWRFFAEKEERYERKIKILKQKQELSGLKKQGLNKSEKPNSNAVSSQDLNEIKKEELDKSIKQELNKLKDFESNTQPSKDNFDKSREDVLKELKANAASTITLEPDHHLRNTVLAILSVIILIGGYFILTKYKVEISALISSIR